MHEYKADNTLYVTISLRKYLPVLFIQIFIAVLIIAGLFLIPQNGIELLEVSRNFTLELNRTFYLIIAVPVILINVSIIIERMLYVRSFQIYFTKRNLEYCYGIFNKTVESIDMHVITDYVIKQDLYDQLLGIANIIIHSEDVRTPLITFESLLMPDAQAIIKYLQESAANTIVEYLINNQSQDKDTHDPHSIKDIHNLQMLQEKEKKQKLTSISAAAPVEP